MLCSGYLEYVLEETLCRRAEQALHGSLFIDEHHTAHMESLRISWTFTLTQLNEYLHMWSQIIHSFTSVTIHRIVISRHSSHYPPVPPP